MAEEAQLSAYFREVMGKNNSSPSGSVTTSKETRRKKTALTVDPNSREPYIAWNALWQSDRRMKLKTRKLTNPSSEILDDHIRFVCISDTHGRIEKKPDVKLPPGDILLHAGDFTMHGTVKQICEFNTFLGRQPHRHKIVIAGNHDVSLDDEHTDNLKFLLKEDKHILKSMTITHPRELLSNCVYLQDSFVEIGGLKIYGSPWTAVHGSSGFAKSRGRTLLRKWNLIPDDVDILMTHGPPVGIGDLDCGNLLAGCVDLLNTVQCRVKPMYHVYGHIHVGYGVMTDGTTTFINASVCNNRYKPLNAPIVFDVPIPKGMRKEDLFLSTPTVAMVSGRV